MIGFQEKYKAEAEEYFEKLEAGLLQLETDPDNESVLGEIFRILHSMKGSGGMFGFDLLSAVTHDLESMFDLFRTGKSRITPEIISFTLEAIDALRRLMNPEADDAMRNLAARLKTQTLGLMRQMEISSGRKEASSPILTDDSKGISTYYIWFKPQPDILDNGTNPLYLLDELATLGHCRVHVVADQVTIWAVIFLLNRFAH